MRSGVLLSPGDGRSHGIGDIGRDLDRVLGHGTYGTVTYASVSTRELGEKTQNCTFRRKNRQLCVCSPRARSEQLEHERQLLRRVPGEIMVLCVADDKFGVLIP